MTLFINGNNIFAGTVSKNFCFTDNGDSWTSKINGIGNLAHVNQFTIIGNTIFAGSVRGIYISADPNGELWHSLKNNGLTRLYTYSIVTNGNNLIAAIDSVGIYVTTDNGDNWTIKNDGLTDTYVYKMIVEMEGKYLCRY